MDPIDHTLERWHAHLKGDLEGGLDALLHPEVTFWSPIVFSPQQGIDITKLYLGAAGATLGGESSDNNTGNTSSAGTFRYVREVASGHNAVLEFETTVEGKYVNGVDLLHCDDDGMITDLKVMIRPLQAVNAVHAQMKAMLERMNG